MWLGVFVALLMDDFIYLADLYHFTTLIIVRIDLFILMPASFLAGLLCLQQWQ
jgi:hypothetical protein